MKKIFFFAAAMAASMCMNAQQPAVEFHYLPTAGGKNAAGTEFNTDDKVSVEADELLISGTNFTVKNAYKTTYKVVGMMTDTAYNTMTIGDEVVDYKIQRIQGQDNPKDATGGNPATSLKVPTQGACFKVEVTKKGMLLVAVKSTPNKNQFAYSDLVGAGTALTATPNSYMYLSMSNNKSANAIGNPDGCLQIFIQGDEFDELKTYPETPAALYGNGAYTTNGVGVMVVSVDPNKSPYIIGTGGSKMMAAGFAFVAEDDANVANLTVVAKGCVDKDGNNHEDVTLLDKNVYTNENLKIQDCSKELQDLVITAFIPEEWAKDTVGYGKDGLKKKVGCYVWGDGITASIHEMAVDKKDSTKYTYTARIDTAVTKSVNAIFINSHLAVSASDSTKHVVSIDWNGNANQTEDLTNITASTCYIVSAAAKEGAKATAVVDEDCDGEIKTAINNVFEDAKKVKFIENGQLYIRVNDNVYNANGALVK